MTNRPFVSVIIPVRNSSTSLRSGLARMTQQSYPRDLYEVVVVDNGSDDSPEHVVKDFQGVRLIRHDEFGSYAARNAGIRVSRGDILAFTDADCVPYVGWIEAGVNAMLTSNADLIGGQVEFNFPSGGSAFELCDAAQNLNIEQAIEKSGAAMTANLFVRRSVFEKFGMFPESVRSGGDVLWTGTATREGYRIAYCSEARIAHPARGAVELLAKAYRVGRGQPAIWRARGESRAAIAAKVIRGLRPAGIRRMRRRLGQQGIHVSTLRSISVWCAALTLRIPSFVGRIRGVLERQ